MSYYKQGWGEASHDKSVEDYEEYFSRCMDEDEDIDAIDLIDAIEGDVTLND